MGFRLTLKWGFSGKPCFPPNSSSWPSLYSIKVQEALYDSARMSSRCIIYGESVSHPIRAKKCSSMTKVRENYNFEKEHLENEVIGCSSCNMVQDTIWGSAKKDNSKHHTSFEDTKALHFDVLMKNLNALEKTIADSGVIMLERDILVQLERLGALTLFQACLCRTLKPSNLSDLSDTPTEPLEEPERSAPWKDPVGKKIIHSGRIRKRKSRRKRSLDKSNDKFMQGKCSKSRLKEPQIPQFASGRSSSNFRSRRLNIASNEAELSRGVKLLTELEKIRKILEENTGEGVSMSSWAEAAQVDKKVLHQHLLFGWYCRDMLLKSTRSLVLYIAKNYRGLGVAFEDLIQAGNLGVLKGAERFDHTRGYKFSTYVQYWIKKSISVLLAQHARGIRIPSSLSRVISKIHQAEETMMNSHGKYPDVNEVAQLTGFSTAKILSASRYLRVVGSIDKKVGDSDSTKLMELIPDTSIRIPEETVLRQHMVEYIYTLLEDLEPRERQSLILRFGLESHHQKSLEEIGKLFSVSKEWIRKIQSRALIKLRKKVTAQNLSHFLYM